MLALGLCGAFLAASWLGLWVELPRPWRIGGVVLFGAALLAILAGFLRWRTPTRAEALARLDRDSGLAHRPATTLDDALASTGDDPATTALWRLHRRRAEAAASRLTLAAPSPRMAERDRYALRGAALVAVVAAAFIAGPERYGRVAAAFDWRTEGAVARNFRLDAWIDPPPYTGKAPVLLSMRGETGESALNRKVTAPVNSTLVVRAVGGGIDIETAGMLAAPDAPKDAANAPATPAQDSKAPALKQDDAAGIETRFTLKGDGRLVVKRASGTIASFDIEAIPDRAPTIAINGAPKMNARGSMTLAYKIDDDYGVIGAEAQVSRPLLHGRVVASRPLVEAPHPGLSLPTGPGGLGEGQTTIDLTESPWAGARVTLTLSARDEGGNEGRGAPLELTLPQRIFVKPVAKALVELRRNLVIAPDERERVGAALDGLMIAPEKFTPQTGIYLGLYTIAARLRAARGDADLLGVADYMWEVALRIEDGDTSTAERDLRAAEQQLREALQRGATDEELRKLMENLRAAMDKFMQELADRAQRDPNQQQAERDQQQGKTITPQDLKSMLDKLEDMARNGNTADAQRMLDQLQRMMENLQTAKKRSQQNQASREMNKALSELDALTREQQNLRDETFRKNQKERNRQRQQGQQGQRGQQQQGQRGQQGQPQQGDQQADDGDDGDGDGADSDQSLQDRQQALRDRLKQLQDKMKQFGMGEKGFDDAGEAMGEAQQGLGEGKSGQGRGKAVDAQGRALEALRKGAQNLAQQMQQQPGDGDGTDTADNDGDGEAPPGTPREGANGTRPDPLGRPKTDRAYNPQSKFDPLGVPASERARRVLEELRKRFSDPSRPREELDYLERLLRRY